jgi:hypothetical protein
MGKSRVRKSSRQGRGKKEPRLSVGQTLLFHGLGYLAVFLVVFTWLLPGGQHHAHGVVTGVDAPSKTLTVRLDATGFPKTYAWSEATAFMSTGERVRPESLVAGTRVEIVSSGSKPPYLAARVQVLARPGES